MPYISCLIDFFFDFVETLIYLKLRTQLGRLLE